MGPGSESCRCLVAVCSHTLAAVNGSVVGSAPSPKFREDGFKPCAGVSNLAQVRSCCSSSFSS